MNWLITGGCGFLGTSLIERLKKEGGQAIRVIDNLTVGTKQDLARVCDFREIKEESLPLDYTSSNIVDLFVGDILDASLALKLCQNTDIIVHFAANTGVPISVQHPREDCMSNVVGTFNYLEGARQNKVPRFIFASSGAPAGEVKPPIHEELPPHPVSPYGASKLAGEGYCSAYFKTYKVETVALRFGNVYGPGSGHKSSVVAKFIKQAINGEALEIYGDGSQTRDFIYIDDLINAVYRAAITEKVGGEIFQIASSKETTISAITTLLVKYLSEQGFKNIDVIHKDKRIGDVQRNYSDTSKAKKILGWKATTDLQTGLKKTIDDLTDHTE